MSLFSSYVWRGVSLTNKPVAQPNVYLTVPAGKASIGMGGWANIDVGSYDDPNDDISQSGGVSSLNVAEFIRGPKSTCRSGGPLTGGWSATSSNDPPALATEDLNTGGIREGGSGAAAQSSSPYYD
jgi:hypothetical protein